MTASFPAVLRERALSHPDRPFLEEIDGPRLSYREMDALVAAWAGRLRRAGVAAGDRVALLLAPGAEELAAWLALGWLHAVGIPVDPGLRGSALRQTLELGRVELVLATAGRIGPVLDVVARLPHLREAVVIDDGPLRRSAPSLRVRRVGALDGPPLDLGAEAAPAEHDLATVLFTSGTTDRPKGVLVPWGQLQATADALAPAEWLGADDAVYLPYGGSHISGRAPVLAMLQRGGRVVMRASFDHECFWEDVRAYRCTVALLFGASIERLLAAPADAGDADNPLRVANLLPAGASGRAFQERFAVRVCTSYNMTELSRCPIVSGPGGVEDWESCGRVREGYECRLVDEWDREVPHGSEGELVVRATRPGALMAGYLDDAPATIAAWRNQWFHTGDILRSDEDGAFHFVRRSADTVRRREELISASLVQDRLTDHPAVVTAAATSLVSDVGDEEVLAWVVLEEGTDDASVQRVAEFLAAELTESMVPRSWRVAEQLPERNL